MRQKTHCSTIVAKQFTNDPLHFEREKGIVEIEHGVFVGNNKNTIPINTLKKRHKKIFICKLLALSLYHKTVLCATQKICVSFMHNEQQKNEPFCITISRCCVATNREGI